METEANPALLPVARQLAAAGRYAAASALLDVLDGDGPTTASQSLRAKVLAQQGRYVEAASLWREVLRTEPDHAEAQAGAARADRAARGFWHRSSGGFKLALASLVLLLGLASVGVAMVAPSFTTRRDSAGKLDDLALAGLQTQIQSAVAESVDRQVREAIERRKLAPPPPVADSEAVEESVRRQTASLVAEIAALREQLSDANGGSPVGVLTGRVDALENTQREQYAAVDGWVREIQQYVRDVRTDQLVWRAMEISNRRPLAGRDLEVLVWIGRELLALNPDADMQKYARDLIAWAESRRGQQ